MKNKEIKAHQKANEENKKPLTKEEFFDALNKVIRAKKPDEKHSAKGKTKTSD
jgi:uncharacterized short protein YbdD (DUF466 family)